MKSIGQLIDEVGLSSLLKPRVFQNIKPHGADEFVEFLSDYCETNGSMLIFGDIDIDGFLSAKILYQAITVATNKQPDVYRHAVSHHGITSSIVMWILQKKYTHVIIADSSSNEIECIQRLCASGVKVFVIDHHVCDYPRSAYPSMCTIMNPMLDSNEGLKVPYLDASCGLLCTLLCNYVVSITGNLVPQMLWVYAIITLYSDCMNLMNEFNVMVINYVRRTCLLDEVLAGISGKDSRVINREIITFSINPKLNACLRLEQFDLVHRLLFDNLSGGDVKSLCTEIIDINKKLKEYLADLEKKLSIWSVNGITLVEVPLRPEMDLTNFKGLLANKIAEQTSQLTIGFCIVDGVIYGSVRDPFSRDCLSIFKLFCKAGGHPSAFGFEIKENRLDALLDFVCMSLDEETLDTRRPVVIDSQAYDLTSQELNDLSLINEYTMSNSVLIKITLDPAYWRIKSCRFGYEITSTKMKVHSSIPVTYGSVVFAIPTLGSKSKLKLKSRR